MAPHFLVGKYVTAEAPPYKTNTLLTSVHNNADNAYDTDKAKDYNSVIGISKYEQNFANTHTHPHYIHEWFQ